MSLSAHPLLADARDTLVRLHNAAVDRADKLRRRLETDEDLPRGPLPLMTKISAHEAEAYHLLMGLAGLGDEEAAERIKGKEAA